MNTILQNFRKLENSPRELYINFVLKFCESYNYFSISQILVIFLHVSFQYSDLQAGATYGFWGMCITLWGLATSTVNDRLGVRNSLLFGFFLSAIATFMLAFTTSSSFLQVILFVFLPLGNSMGMPMLSVGIRRCTTTETRGFAFGLFYSVMNVGAFVSGLVVDGMNIGVGSCELFGVVLDGNRLVILSTAVSSCISFTITWFTLREVNIDENLSTIHLSNLAIISNQNDADNQNCGVLKEVDTCKISSKMQTLSRKSTEDSSVGLLDWNKQGQTQMFQENTESVIVSNPIHHTGIQQKYSKLNALDEELNSGDLEFVDVEFTTQQEHTHTNVLGKSDELHSEQSKSNYDETYSNVASTSASSGALSAHLIIVKELFTSMTFWRFVVLSLFLINLKAIFRHLDATLPTYLVRTFGPGVPKGTIYGINPFMIMFLTPVVSALTTQYAHYDMIKYGGYLSAISPFFLAISESIWAAVMFVVVLSLGEAIWSPRTYDYTMSIAPEGREASFAALSTAPLFVATVPVGLLAGVLTSAYLPENGPRNGRLLWCIVGLTTLSSPILITVLEKYIREPTKPAYTSNTSYSTANSTDIAENSYNELTNEIENIDDQGNNGNISHKLFQREQHSDADYNLAKTEDN